MYSAIRFAYPIFFLNKKEDSGEHLFGKKCVEQMPATPKVISSIPAGKAHIFFSYKKEVEDISRTNQPCKRSQTCLGFLKEAALTYCGCRVRKDEFRQDGLILDGRV
jgi:hypothetical protein